MTFKITALSVKSAYEPSVRFYPNQPIITSTGPTGIQGPTGPTGIQGSTGQGINNLIQVGYYNVNLEQSKVRLNLY